MFYSERLCFRAYVDSDKPFITSLINTAQIQHTLSNDHLAPKTQGYITEHISDMEKGFLFAIVTLRQSHPQDGVQEQEQAVGYVDAELTNARNRDSTMSIAIIPAYQGKGYAKETMLWAIDHLFKNMGVHRITLTVFANNPNAKALYEKLCVFPFQPLSTLQVKQSNKGDSSKKELIARLCGRMENGGTSSTW